MEIGIEKYTKRITREESMDYCHEVLLEYDFKRDWKMFRYFSWKCSNYFEKVIGSIKK